MNARPNRTSDPPQAARGSSGRSRSSTGMPSGGQAAGRSPTPPHPGDGQGTGYYQPPGPTAGPAHDDDAPVYVISIAAQLAGMHPQTLRSYDRLGLVTPGRTAGRGRRYSARDVALLREVQRLSQEEGVNLEGIRQILHLGAQVVALQAQVRQLAEELAAARVEADRRVAEAHASHRRDLVPIERGAVVVWRPGHRR
ncbi:heat shock protein transcriptional repressor HspR [Parafrankia sp. EUN1f]|uniref:heat shock protein transcriptional repressor HspR n=1 Tax=Parafrankia sp. EUN1f TaxID=102897 RepID=UPI0001C44E2A|nr:helix-turn-helix transcriptional regulator [Parafrankia sp. EUN1f]EFC84093.1 transcriptional regulator, MerR family [Parafrankia sp. EUN1f]